MKKWWIKFGIMSIILFVLGSIIPDLKPERYEDMKMYHIIDTWKYVMWYTGFCGLVATSVYCVWSIISWIVGNDDE